MTEQDRVTAIRLLRVLEVTRSQQNANYNRTFGDRLTKALTAECNQRDREIKACLATIELLEALEIPAE